MVAVSVDSGRGVSIEAAARDSRYAVLAQNLGMGECLLTAHHADDQAETLLLQLLRGAGLKGMAAMPLCRAWAGGWHLRPLLQFALDQRCHVFEKSYLILAEVTRTNVQHAQRSDATLTDKQRTPSVEANPGSTGDIGVVGKSGIFKGVRDHQHLACRSTRFHSRATPR